MPFDPADLFSHIMPGFFEQPHIRSLPEDEVFEEMLMPLQDYSPDALEIPVPGHITFGVFNGDFAALQESIREVDPDWVEFFHPADPVFCAFDGDRVVSFCLLDDFGEYQGLRLGAPGCVGTVPSHRRLGIGLRMVQLASQRLKEDGYDLGYIHYTAVGHWYSRLGYRTILRWNCKGIL